MRALWLALLLLVASAATGSTAAVARSGSDELLQLDALPRLLQEEQQTGTAAGGSPATPGAYGAEEATTLQAASKEASLVAAQASADGSSSSEAAMPTAGSDKVVEQLTGGQIAGVVLGVAAAAGLTAVGVMAYRRHKRHASSTYGSGRYMRHGDIEML